MADEDDFESDEPEFEAAPEGAGRSKKKLILLVAIPLVLVIGGGAAAYFTGLADPLLAMFRKEEAAAEGAEGAAHEGGKAGEAAKAAAAADQPVVNYELPDMLVNIDTGTRAKSFLKIKASVELNNEADIERVVAVLPKIVDNFQLYLREMKQDDLTGAGGMYKLREELLIRINAAVRPVQVKDVLFKEFIVQ